MNMKDIPSEVLKWLFDQQKKGEQFAIYVNLEWVGLRNGSKWEELANHYANGHLLAYLAEAGYTERSQQEHDSYIDELVAEYEHSSKDGSLSDVWNFFEQKGLLDEFFKSTFIFSPPETDE